jgi:tetratricopeptide (TPR) repeat protein
VSLGRWLQMAALALAVAGCATSNDVPRAEALYVDAAFSPAIARPDAAQVFALSPAMQAYLDREIAPRMATHSPQKALIDELYTGQQLLIDYDAELTRTAAEAFEARAGNCLSLVILTGALAKAMGLAVRYQSVEVDHSWAREGDLALYMGHVNIAIGRRVASVRVIEDSPDWWTVDFMSPPDARRLRTLPITEQRVVAMYFNNKAAEAMTRDGLDDSYAWARAALEADPLYTDAYNTLGVVYLRRGLLPAAERALQAALARRENHPQALANLAIVWRRQGREAEAQAVEDRLARMRALSPFATFERGRQAYEAGDFGQARDLFRRALAVANDYHEFHFWLALAQWRLGDDADALRHLHLAEENSLTRRQQAVYAVKQRWLQGHGGQGAAAPAAH